MDDKLIFFTHYGFSSYLNYTLKLARKTNLNKRLIFLGDESNKLIAKKYGWEHYNMFLSKDLTPLHTRFNECYRDVQGASHISIRNGHNWLKFVFERWFFIYDYCVKNKINEFWHFDSDTLILKNLDQYSYLFQKYDFSTQCNNSCLNGIISIDVVAEYCQLICELFEDLDFINNQQYEFDNANPHYAFTEMRAFEIFMRKTNKIGLHLGEVVNGEVFDDCICQDHGFDTFRLPTGELIKRIFSIAGRIYGYKNSNKIQFVTLNLSWVPSYLYRWVTRSLNGEIHYIEDIRCGLVDYAKYYIIQIKMLLIRIK